MRNQMKYVIQIKLILLVTWATQAFADDSFAATLATKFQRKILQLTIIQKWLSLV